MKKILKEIFLLLLPLAYIAYILYIRLFMVRMPRMLYVKTSYFSISITTIIIFFLLLRIYHLLKKEDVIKETKKETPLRSWFSNKGQQINNIISTIWINFFTFFTQSFLKLNFIIVRFAKLVVKYKFSHIALTILVIFEVLPKLIIVIAFIVDIFVYQQFYYFYKTLVLLLLPIIYSTIRAILLQFNRENIDAQESFITKTMVVTDGKFFRVAYAFADHFEPPDYIKDLDDFLENHYLPIKCIPSVLAYYDAVKIYYKINWLFIAILILHLLGWITILFFGIYV